MHDLARLAQEHTSLGEIYDLVGVAEDFTATLRTELDYCREGRNADRFRASFVDESNLQIPHIYWDYSTQRVLVMERIAGIEINDVVALGVGILGATRRRSVSRFVDAIFSANIAPHSPGNCLVI